MADDMVKEQIYTIPLRDVKRVPAWKRANRAVTEVRGFLMRHMKVDSVQVKLDKSINERLWEKGCKKPPLSIRVRAVKFADGEVHAELAQ
ncbi:MAG: 50S ribosomal protein L31e [Methanosarcina flavescens]|jgi:large subunit ribosomal protein L31e|uniref:Large ribosomal subunit protein eL31 n=1 Tax=Methanosarcina flavescens TaxID=1715806 RepID=A0A660HRZ8_9EURY|nr:50S ribosomal protein L31e [Methanosarcina flavescens]AYK14836.1 50S ribosomal protein L31e [Methanosarcina flavescens]NLK32916.1 50S ribosomal protein L31e [Methanosarcina flavescens]